MQEEIQLVERKPQPQKNLSVKNEMEALMAISFQLNQITQYLAEIRNLLRTK